MGEPSASSPAPAQWRRPCATATASLRAKAGRGASAPAGRSLHALRVRPRCSASARCRRHTIALRPPCEAPQPLPTLTGRLSRCRDTLARLQVGDYHAFARCGGALRCSSCAAAGAGAAALASGCAWTGANLGKRVHSLQPSTSLGQATAPPQGRNSVGGLEPQAAAQHGRVPMSVENEQRAGHACRCKQCVGTRGGAGA